VSDPADRYPDGFLPPPLVPGERSESRDAAPAPDASAPPAYPDELKERLFQATQPFFRGGASSGTSGLWLVVTLALFVLARSSDRLTSIAVLVGVLLFHELGHWAGMRLFGYADVRMFFIPFFGAAVSGRPRGAAAWKEAVVSLLGPVPGILAGIAALAALRWRPVPLVVEIAQTLLTINVFNLLPLGGLDGGRFQQRILFSRHRVLEGLFAVGSAGLLGLLAAASSSVVLAIFALLGLAGLGARWRVLGVAQGLRREGLSDANGDPAKADEATVRRLFDAALGLEHATPQGTEQRLGTTMQALLEATRPAPGFLASAGLMVGWVIALGAGAAASVFILASTSLQEWKRHETPQWSAEMPAGIPQPMAESVSTPAGPRLAWTTMGQSGLIRAYRVRTVMLDAPVAEAQVGAWLEWARDAFATEVEAKVVREQPLPGGGREVFLTRGWRSWRLRVRVAGSDVHFASAGAPDLGADEARFVESFELKEPRDANADDGAPASR